MRVSLPTRRMYRSSPPQSARGRAFSSRTTSDTFAPDREYVSFAHGRSSKKRERGWHRSRSKGIGSFGLSLDYTSAS